MLTEERFNAILSILEGKKAVTVYLATAVIVFFVFFPVVSGFPVDREWGMKLRWLKDWILVL